MQRQFGNIFNRSQGNRNDPPAHRPHVEPGRAAAVNDPPPAPHTAVARAPRPVPNRERVSRQRMLQLSDLRTSPNEPAHELVTIPSEPGQGLAAFSVRTDAQSQHLTGRDLLEFLSTDRRNLIGIRQLIAGRHILAANPPLPSERINNIAERLRPVVAEIYHDAENRERDLARGRESTLATDVDRLADDVLNGCGDRLDLMLKKMEAVALVARLSRGDIDEVTLYNHGVAFFMLHQVLAETGREATAHGAALEAQSVHAPLDAIYFLQDTLHLPHRVARPQYYDRGISFMTEDIARRIGDRVRAAATEGDGERVIEFMSEWEPWVLHMEKHADHRGDFDEMKEIYGERVNALEIERADPDSVYHPSRMDEVTYQCSIGEQGEKLRVWTSELVGQLTKTFLVNHRADYLSERGALPAYFNFN